MTVTLIALGLKSLLVAAVTLLLLRLTRHRSAAERSTIAHLGLFALVALPLASLFLPALPVSLPEALAMPVAVAEPVAQSGPIAMPASWEPFALPETAEVQPASVLPTEPAAPLARSPSMGERAAALARYAYALPALALLLLTGIALLRLVALRSRAQVLVDPHWVGALARAQHRMGFKNGTALLTSAELRSPISWGLLRPTILVNESALGSGRQAEAVLAHELAHVIHMDWAKLMLARVATAAFWFNPLAWVLAREAHQLREEAADDAVLAADIAGTDYAELLVGVARHENRGLLLGAHGVAPGRGSLHRRVARVLDTTPARRASGVSWVAGFTTGMLVMAAPLAAVTFGPARARSEPAAPLAKADPAPSTSWSTRAGEAPNQIVAAAPHVDGHNRAALAAAVNGLHDDAPGRAGRTDGPSGSVMPGTPEWAAAWERFGNAIGQRYAQAFAPMGPMPTARPAPHANPVPGPNFNFDFEYGDFAPRDAGKRMRTPVDVDAMLGITEDYRKDLAEAGFPNASQGELVAARTAGLNSDNISDLRAGGVKGAISNFVQARNAGLSGHYMQDLHEAGLSGSIAEYVQARSMGVTGSYVRGLKDAGLEGSLRDYIAARASGLTASYVGQMAALGIDASFGEYQQLHALGVTPGYVRTLHRNGTDITDPGRLIEIRTRGFRSGRSDDP